MQLGLLYKRFLRGIKWNSIEASLYYTTLGLHQWILFSVASRETYGLIGASFASMYLLISVTNLGFDISMAPFFKLCTRSKHSFKWLLLAQFIPQTAMILIVATLVVTIKPKLFLDTDLTIALGHTWPILLFWVVVTTVFEATKRSLRVLLQLAFWNKVTSIIEIIDVLGYVTIFWTLYMWYGHRITLWLAFVPMAITSMLAVITLTYFAYKFFQTLPTKKTGPIPKNSVLRVIKSRFCNYINSTASQVFSSNFLIPYFATQFSLERVGVFHITSITLTFISVVIQKVFGFTGGAFLSNIKDMTTQAKVKAFSSITTWLYNALYAFVIIFCINQHLFGCFSNLSGPDKTNLYAALLFVCINLADDFLLAHRKMYIVEEQVHCLLIFNLIDVALFVLAVSLGFCFPDYALFMAMAAIKIATSVGIAWLSYLKWQVIPNWRPRFKFLSVITLLSIFFRLASYLLES